MDNTQGNISELEMGRRNWSPELLAAFCAAVDRARK
jgi:hypothetical protein